MNQLKRIWTSLTLPQRISLVVVPLIVAAIGWGLVYFRHENDFRNLYTGLAPEDALAVTQKLREGNIEFKLDETGSTVLVPSAKLAEGRLAIAGAGLPRTGRIGFELFDRTNLGVSDFTEQVNFRRALEGELERTVASLAEVSHARIHLTLAKESVFLDSRQPAKATVVLTLKHTTGLSKGNITAIANLVASAVDNLSPESVAIIDGAGRLLNRPSSGDENDARVAESNYEYRRQIESDLLSRINTQLEPLVGTGRFRTGLSVECDLTNSEESVDLVDASGAAIITSQSTEESLGAASTGGMPGTASNLPAPPPRATGSGSGTSRRTENVSYQPSRTVRKTISPRGAIRRVSASVLVDQSVRWEGFGPKAKRTLVPPSPETLKGIQQIVAGIVGFNDQRGDKIIVESVPFESTLSTEPPPAPPQPAKPAPPFDFKSPVFIGSVAAGLFLLLAVAFLMVRRPKKKKLAATDTAPGAVEAAAAGETPHTALAAAETPQERMEQDLLDAQAEQAQLEAETLSRIKLPANTKKTEVLVRHIRESITKDPGAAANVLRTWVADTEPKRG